MKGGFKVGITVCAEKLSPSAPVVFTGDLEYAVRRCSELGYDGVELQLRNPDSLDRILLFSLLDRYGLRVSAIATGLEYTLAGLSMISDDEKVRAELRRRIFADIALAQKLGCPVIVGCIRGNIPDSSDREKLLARFREELLLYSAEAQKLSVTLVIEAINFYINNYLCTVRETCDFIDSLGRDNVKLHVDTHHMAIEEKDMIRAVELAGKRIGYVHLAENNRMYPGSSCIDFPGVLKALEKTGYKGWVTFEIIPEPDADTAAANSIDYIASISSDSRRGGKANAV